MADRAFDRYGRILGSTGYDYVIDRISQGMPLEEIVDSINYLHPQFDRSEVQQFVSEGLQAKIATDALNAFLTGQKTSEHLDTNLPLAGSVDWHDFVILNPRLFGVAPEGDRYKYTFEFGESEGLPLIKVSVTSSEFLDYFEAYRQAYEQAVDITGRYPGKFGLTNPDEAQFLYSRAYAPEKRW